MSVTPSGPTDGVRLRTGALIFATAAILTLALGLGPMAENGWNATTLMRVGEQGASRSYVEQDFAPPIVMGDDYGHDGQQFYVLATSFPHLERAEGHVDHLTYRSRRILLPFLASPFPSGMPTLWAMFAINVIAVAFATVGVGRLAARVGLSPWLGLSVAVIPSMVESVQGVLGDAPAFCLAVWAVVLRKNHIWVCALFLALAALSRETSLVVALALFIVGERKERIAIAAGVAGWFVTAAAITLWLSPYDQSVARGPLSHWMPPFTAVAGEGWTSNAALLAFLLIGTSLFAAWVFRRTLPELSLWLLFDAFLVVIVDDAVTFRPQNLARIAPMALPAFVLAAAVVWQSRERSAAMAD